VSVLWRKKIPGGVQLAKTSVIKRGKTQGGSREKRKKERLLNYAKIKRNWSRLKGRRQEGAWSRERKQKRDGSNGEFEKKGSVGGEMRCLV